MAATKRLSLLLGMATAAAPSLAAAQELIPEQPVPERPGPSRQETLAMKRQIQLREALQGTEVGPFTLYPTLAIGSGYDSNIYATPNNQEEDHVTVFSPSAGLRSDWANHALNLSAGAEVGRYSSNESENYEDFYFSGDGRFDLTERTYLFGGGGYSLEHEPRTSPDDVLGEEPTPYRLSQGHAGLAREGKLFTFQGGLSYERLNYEDVAFTATIPNPGPGRRFRGGRQPTVTGIFNNDDRDREVWELGGRAGIKYSRNWKAFVQGTANRRDYDNAPDDFGFRRDSTGAGGAVGLAWTLPRRLQWEMLVGYMKQNYDDPALQDVSTIDYGTELSWRPIDGTRVAAYVQRSIEETTQPGASSYLYTVSGAQLRHVVTGNLQVSARASYGQTDYQGVNREDDLIGIGGSVQYYFYRQIYVEPDYQFSSRQSNLRGGDYQRSRAMLYLGMEL